MRFSYLLAGISLSVAATAALAVYADSRSVQVETPAGAMMARAVLDQTADAMLIPSAQAQGEGTARGALTVRPDMAAVAPEGGYRIVGVGDMMLGSDWPQPGMDPRVTEDADASAVLGPEIADLFQSADALFGNFEGTLHSSSAGAKACSNPSICFTFRSPEFHAAYLKRAGFDLISNANNHARDFGEGGRTLTYNNLVAAGFAVSASDHEGRRFGLYDMGDGTRVALVAFGHNPGLMRVQDLPRVSQLVREAGNLADIVVVSCHIGAEGSKHDRVTRATEMFLGEDRGNPYAFAHRAVDAGADVVFCHGPHVPRAVEVYQGRFIAYSLGNFWTYGRFNLSGISGQAPIADLRVAKDGSLLAARIVSARQDRPGGPYLDNSHAAARTIAMLTARDFPESGISFSDDGVMSWPR